MKLSSDTGNNVKASVWGILAIFAPVIASMPPGYERTGLIALVCLTMAIINWRTAGSGISPKEGAEIKEAVLDKDLDHASVEDLLQRGRQ